MISLFCITFVLIEFLNKSENPPVITNLKDLLVSFLIKLIILSIKPAYPQKKPDLTALIVSTPIIFLIFLRLILGIKEALSDKVFKDILIPGAITPPLYVFLIITSKVVAVPKSKIMKLSLLFNKLIALVSLSEPTCL